MNRRRLKAAARLLAALAIVASTAMTAEAQLNKTQLLLAAGHVLLVAGASGSLHLGRRRQPLSRLLLAAGQRQHRPPAPARWSPRSRSRPAGCARSRRSTPTTCAREAARLIAERAPDDLRQGVLHQRRRRRDRERGADGPAAHRPAQGARRRYRSYHGDTDDRDPADRRPAPLGQRRRRHRRRALLRALPLPLAVLVASTEAAGVRARAGAPRAGASRSRGPAPIAAIVLETDPRHGRHPRPAGRLPRRRPRDLRPARHRL